MRIWVFIVFLMVSAGVNASDIYQCKYAKAKIVDGTLGALSFPVPAKVEIIGKSIKTFRPDGSFIISTPLNTEKGDLLMADDGSKVYAATKDRTSFAFSDKIARTTEQWDNCEPDLASSAQDKVKSDVQDQMKKIASIPWGGPDAHRYFMKETHLFMLLNCGWAGSVGFSTGKKPLVMLGDSYYQSQSSSFKDGEYSITFNSGSMRVAYNPRKVKGYISDGSSFTLCEVVRLGED